jgi:hypothetical protein
MDFFNSHAICRQSKKRNLTKSLPIGLEESCETRELRSNPPSLRRDSHRLRL